VRLPEWPAALDGLRLVVLSDLHAGAGAIDDARVRTIVEAANSAHPDLVVLLGDFVDATAVPEEHGEAEQVAGRLAGLRTPLGVYGLLGNHDRARHGAHTMAALERAGITVLENRAARVGGLWLAGVSDTRSARADPEAALAGVPHGEPVVAITHSPDVFPRIPRRVALTLAGDTHAGQVNVPLLRRLFIPSRFGDRYRVGLIEEDGHRLLVHPGIGTSRLPVRLGATPEVTVLELSGRTMLPR
jgi:predicted MPP superfamily phosphohydrolase